jgi:hypothetical protein
VGGELTNGVERGVEKRPFHTIIIVITINIIEM